MGGGASKAGGKAAPAKEKEDKPPSKKADKKEKKEKKDKKDKQSPEVTPPEAVASSPVNSPKAVGSSSLATTQAGGTLNLKEFHVVATNEPLKSKSPGGAVILEIAPTGFRVVRGETRDGLTAFPWGQIHSWAHSKGKFSFRYFDERKRSIEQHTFTTQEVSDILAHITSIVQDILSKRKQLAISESDFEQLKENLTSCDPTERLSYIKTATEMNYFSSTQAQLLTTIVADSFDKVEAVCAFHPRLVDQCNFSQVLAALDCADDRENVWHRLQSLKKTF